MTTMATHHELTIRDGKVELIGDLTLPSNALGLVIFAHGSGSSRLSPRNRMVADELVRNNCATLLFDLLTETESAHRANVFDIDLLARRLLAASTHMREQAETATLPQGYFGASTGAAAALVAASIRPDPAPEIVAIVSRGGRPDLAGKHLSRITCPTLLLVGSLDTPVLDLNRQARKQLAGPSQLEIINGATHLFEEPGALEDVARRAAEWFTPEFKQHL